jgi:hypothetical protein
MNSALAKTIQHVTGKPNLSNSTSEELANMVAQHPYFIPAQLVYTAKLKSEKSFKAATQIQKAGLFFNNFKWLQFQLSEVTDYQYSIEQVEKPHEIIVAKEEELQEPIEETKQPTIVIVEEQVIAQPILEANQPQIEEQIVAQIEPEEIAAKPTEIVEEQQIVAQSSSDQLMPPNYNFIPQMDIPTFQDVKNIIDGIDDRNKPTENTISQPVILFDTTIEEHQKEFIAKAQEQTILENIEPTQTAELPTIEALPIEKDNYTEENYVNEHPELKIQLSKADSLAAEIAALKASWQREIPVADVPLILEPEPYYTIDYFASQGIKFDTTKQPQDKLTTKMLRFTDWLKKMRSINKIDKSMMSDVADDENLDDAIQRIAATSNQTKEIVTETMANIFALQGKKEKAIQLYIKLSFLIPAKSTYFANRIKELKGI